METLIEATDRLRYAGFKYDLAPTSSASLLCGCGRQMDVGSTVVLQTVRTECSSDPGSKEVLLALITPCGHAGLLAVGSELQPDVDAAEVLSRVHRDPRSSRNDPRRNTVPSEYVLVRTSNEFTELTIPAALLRVHRLAPDVWGRLRVLRGRVVFAFEASPYDAISLSVGAHVDIPPKEPHSVEPLTDARFVIEFFEASVPRADREPNEAPSREKAHV
jgi:tellurite resistance-related uncharacterized protein